MKKMRLFLTVGLVAVGLMCDDTSLGAKDSGKEKQEMPAAKGSIHPAGKVKAVDLPALAKISFDEALKAAHVTFPGAVIKAELEVEDGNLQYSFDIVGADKKVTEVEIDAGDGKVLTIDQD